MKTKYIVITLLVLLMPIVIISSLIMNSNDEPSIKITSQEIITEVPGCSEPKIELNKIKNVQLLDSIDIKKKQIGVRNDDCYAGYYSTDLGQCYIYIDPSINNYIYFEIDYDKYIINIDNNEETQNLYNDLLMNKYLCLYL